MAEKPKLSTVARAAGVSLATVSQVMRGTGRISDETRRKVLEAAERVAYVPDARAAAMRSGQSREIGLLIHKIANPFNAEVIAGVSDLLETEDYLVSVLDSRDDPDREHSNIQALIRNMRGGILWVPAMDSREATFDLLETHRLPVVTFLRRARNTGFDHVTIENAKATREATSYLASLGHKHIAYIGGRRSVESRLERIDGYRSAMRDNKLGAEIVIPCEDTKLAGMEMMVRIRDEHPEITAFVCNGDMVALGLVAGMNRMGIRPGVDISVVGFDDIQDAAVSTPALTTMAVRPYDLGRKLARVLLDRIHEPEMPVTSILIPAQLVIRETTGKCV